MKKYTPLLFFFILFYLVPRIQSQQKIIRVAIYNDTGGGGTGADNVQLCLSNGGIFSTQLVDAKDIRSGILGSFDVLVQSGGSGSKQAKTLEPSGVDSIRQFVNRGGGYLGICAGAYLASSQYKWSLGILNAMVVDHEHWNRGGANVQLALSDSGKKFFNSADSLLTVQYHQGPLLAPGDNEEVKPYRELASFKTEVAENGAPEGIMVGTTAIAQGEFGLGRVVAVSPHPEKSADLRPMIATIVRWLGKEEKTK